MSCDSIRSQLHLEERPSWNSSIIEMNLSDMKDLNLIQGDLVCVSLGNVLFYLEAYPSLDLAKGSIIGLTKNFTLIKIVESLLILM